MDKIESNWEMCGPSSCCLGTSPWPLEVAHLGKGPEEDDALDLMQLAPGSQLLPHVLLQLRLRKRGAWPQRKGERCASRANADGACLLILRDNRRSPCPHDVSSLEGRGGLYQLGLPMECRRTLMLPG